MTDAPEKIWAGNDWRWTNRWDWEEPVLGWDEYTRSDIAQARIDTLYYSLGQLMQVQEGVPMTGIEATRRLKQAHAALKGSDT